MLVAINGLYARVEMTHHPHTKISYGSVIGGGFQIHREVYLLSDVHDGIGFDLPRLHTLISRHVGNASLIDPLQKEKVEILRQLYGVEPSRTRDWDDVAILMGAAAALGMDEARGAIRRITRLEATPEAVYAKGLIALEKLTVLPRKQNARMAASAVL